MSNILMPDCLDVVRAIGEDAMHGLTPLGHRIVPPRYAVRCSTCHERVEARQQIVGANGIQYVLRVDSEGRCSSCVLTLCLSCDGREGGCQKCDYTGQEIS